MGVGGCGCGCGCGRVCVCVGVAVGAGVGVEDIACPHSSSYRSKFVNATRNGYRQSSRPHRCVLQRPASNSVWAAVLATTALLRFVACTRTPFRRSREMYQPIALDFSRSSSSAMLIAAFPEIQERFSLIAFISNFGTFRVCDFFRRLVSRFSFRTHFLHVLGPHKGFHRGLRLGTSRAYHVLSVWSVLQLHCVIASASGARFSMPDVLLVLQPLLLQHHHPDTIVLVCFKHLGLLMIVLVVLHWHPPVSTARRPSGFPCSRACGPP